MSECMEITPSGILVYIGHEGDFYEIIGGREDGQINLSEL